MTQCKSSNTTSNSNNSPVGVTPLNGSDSHSQLDMRKVPQEAKEQQQQQPPPRYQRHQQQQQQQQQHYSSRNEQKPVATKATRATTTAPTITLTPTSLEEGIPVPIPVTATSTASTTPTFTGPRVEHMNTILAGVDVDVAVGGGQAGQPVDHSMVQRYSGGGGAAAGEANKAVTATATSAADNDPVYKGPKLWRLLVFHWTSISTLVALFMIFIALWTIACILVPEYAQPHTAITRIFLLFVGAQICGILMTLINLPDMLGMLFFGVLYANVGWADFSGYQPFEAFLREMALINIMLLAGFGLDAKAFRSLWFMILRLTLIPTVAEVTVITLLAYWLLNMPWLWGITLGLVVTAISPNVVVTVMLKLKEERLGLNGGIHTLIYAMTTCNDVVAIFFFGVVSGIIFESGNLTAQILQGPIGIGIGIVYGYLYGLMLQCLPSRKSNFVDILRFILIVLGGTISVMGSRTIGYQSAGALGCVTMAFVAGLGWRRQQQQQRSSQMETAGLESRSQQNGNETLNVAVRLDLLWKFLKPVSFALIGKEIKFALLDGTVVGYGALLVLLGSLFRLAFAYVSTHGGELTWRERAYITISGFPKATVQAALGPIALDTARALNNLPSVTLAHQVLIISVLAIIFTAPLGAILMIRLAPHWLKRSPDDMDLDSCSRQGYNNATRRGSGGGCGDIVLDLKASEDGAVNVVEPGGVPPTNLGNGQPRQ